MSKLLKILYRIKVLYIKLFFKDVTISFDVILKKRVKIRNRGGKISIGNGTVFENDVYISAVDGGEIFIGNNVYFNKNCAIVARCKVYTGNGSIFGPGVYIYDHNHKFSSSGVQKNGFNLNPVVVENGCWVGAGCIILKGAYIGQGSVVGAGCIISNEIPPKSIAKSNNNYVIEAIYEKGVSE